MINKFLTLVLFIIVSQHSFANDPFTRSLGEPEPVVQEPIQEPQSTTQVQQPTKTPQENQQVVDQAQNQDNIDQIEKILKSDKQLNETVSTDQEPVQQTSNTPLKEKVPVPKSSRDDYVSKIVNVDPVIGNNLDQYVLKGVAISKIFKNVKKKKVFNKKIVKNRKNVDLGKIPTTHLIKKGETVENIAARYGFSVKEIQVANAIIPGKNIIIPGNRLVIPNRYHVIKEGESISQISEIYGLNPAEVAAFNNLGQEEDIFVDQKLLLPFYVHVTMEEQTINEIAKIYGRASKEILEANNLEENKLINKDQFVKIPIHVNHENDFQNLNIKSVLDYRINPKNLAIIEIGGAQFMVKEGDMLGDKNGKIVSIKPNEMIVVENGREHLFRINAPLSGSSVASAPVAAPTVPGVPTNTDAGVGNTATTETPGGQTNNDGQANTQNQEESGDASTDIESLFN